MELNNIQFNNVKSDGGLFGVTPLLVNDGSGQAIHGVDPEFGGIINAVDIDWNGATLSYVNQPGVLDASNQVNTTGQLLALMNNLQSRLSA